MAHHGAAAVVRPLIAFGCAMTDPEAYRRYARPGIERAAERGAEVYAFAAVGAISRGYNLLLEAAGRRDDLEALVLLHQEVELTDPELCAKVRAALADPDVAAVGCAGATGVRSIAWWDGEVSAGSVSLRYQEHGGGEMPALSWKEVNPAPAEVEMVDGFLMVLSPWAVRNVDFDEGLTLGHGYDLDYCMRLREAGRKVMTADFHAARHLPLELVDDHDLWIEAHMRVAARWEGRDPGLPAPAGDWKTRARRAEAEREAARTRAYSAASHAEAQVTPLQEQLAELESTLAWRLTRPLRELNRRRRGRAGSRP